MRNDLSKGIGTHDRSAPLVMDHVQVRGFGKTFSGRKTECAAGVSGLAVLVSCNDLIVAIDLVMPRAAVPMVVANEIKQARRLRHPA